MELTRKEIEKLANPDMDKSLNTFASIEVAIVAKQLLREMDKPNLFYGVDEWVKSADVQYNDKNGKHLFTMHYDRTLPKSRIDEIAEEAAREIEGDEGMVPITARRIKYAILKDREERGEK